MKEIKPTYATFEQAKWLKENRFIEPTLTYWSKRDGLIENEITLRNHNERGEWSTSRPEQWQVVEWLRFNHDIWVSVIKIDGFQDLYYYTITGSSEFFNNGRTITVEEWDDETCDKMGYNNKYFNSPQEAYSAAFDYIKDNNLI